MKSILSPVEYVGHPDQTPPVRPSKTRNAVQTREERTQALIDNYRGSKDEFAMLKGVLCATHKMNYADELVFEGLLNGLMIAARMDELIIAARKG